MQVSIYQRQEDLPLDSSQIESLVREVFTFLQLSADEVILHFVGEKEITQLHKIFFDDPTPTDCITFPIDPRNEDPSYSVLGECFICPKVGMEYSPDTPYEEISLYIVHCILHLSGYDDIKDEDLAKMREAETFVLKNIREKNLMLSKASFATKQV